MKKNILQTTNQGAPVRGGYKLQTRGGYSIIEALLAAAVFSLIVTALIGAYIYGRESTALSGKRDRAHLVAKEGLEAVRSIRDLGYANLVDGTWSVAIAGNKYTLVPTTTPDLTDVFSRQIQISTVDGNRKLITSTVSWQQNMQRTGAITLSTYLSYWSKTVSVKKGGVLVYGDGGTTSDLINYKIFDANTSTWSAAAATADIDPGSTNRALRVAKLYSSVTRNEKVLITRHYDGVNQYIYAQIFNGTTWGNATLLSSWNSTTLLDVQNFDGAYLNNGDFMAVYSDNTTTPKFIDWDGTVWGAAASTRTVGGIPNYIVTKNRPATNELMAVTFDNQNDTNSEYFNGGAYIQASWTLHSEHATQAPVNTKNLIDFTWNRTDATKGVLVFANNQNDRSTRYKVFTANGTGGGSWSNTTNGANQGSSSTRLGVLRLLSRPNATEFITCSQNTVPQIICYRSNTALAITNPTNPIIAVATDPGIQKTFDFAYEFLNGVNAISVYSDNSATPRLKKYTPATNTFDINPTNITNLSGVLKTSRTVSQPTTDDIMILMADANRALYSQVWDGNNHQLYSSADAWGFNSQSSNGSAVTDYFYDYAWDIF